LTWQIEQLKDNTSKHFFKHPKSPNNNFLETLQPTHNFQSKFSPTQLLFVCWTCNWTSAKIQSLTTRLFGANVQLARDYIWLGLIGNFRSFVCWTCRCFCEIGEDLTLVGLRGKCGFVWVNRRVQNFNWVWGVLGF
jgi:hypothetical protein